ncbi:RNA-guided endonuclease InsQ/TnpB family protein [Natronocella acetinitrilica]|nr:transposase [Natronocella acetinitrilica]
MRAYKLRIYPSGAQQKLIERWLGAGRWAWNHALERRQKAYRRRKESVSGVDVSRAITALKKTRRYAWLKAIPSSVVTQRLRDQDKAFAAFFKGDADYPRFKKRHQGQSIRLQLDQRHTKPRAYWLAGEVMVPGLGVVKARGTHPRAFPKMVTLRRDGAGRYFASVMVEEVAPAAKAARGAVGIDLGLAHLATLSSGEKITNGRPYRTARRRLRRAQRALSRQRKGSQRYRRQKQRIARLNARVANTRRDALHKLTRRLIDENQVVCVESLCITGLAKSKLAASVHDAGWGELLRQLRYKAAWAGREVIAIDRFAPSTRRCSACTAIGAKRSLSVRAWTCEACGAEHDRDINAAKNILELGLNELLPAGSGEVMRVEGDTPRLGAAACGRHRRASVEARTWQAIKPCPEQGAVA